MSDEKILYIAFDTETTLMAMDNVIPEMICMTDTNSMIYQNGNGVNLSVPWEDSQIAQRMIHWMENYIGNPANNVLGYTSVHLVGHYTAFDMSVMSMMYPELLPYFFKWLDEDRVHDTKMREMMINLTLYGSIDDIEIHGVYKKVGYGLADLETKYLGIDRHEQKEREDACRMTYHLMKDKPVNEWPPEYVTYACDDAVNTLKVFLAQEEERNRIISEKSLDPFMTETFRGRTSFALRLMECIGSLVDVERLEQVKEEVMSEYMSDRLRSPLIAQGFLRDAIPPEPYKNGAKDHTFGCIGHKEHPQHIKGYKDCDCPIKMKKGNKESYSTATIQDYVLACAKANPIIMLQPSDSCMTLLKKKEIHKAVLDDDGFFKPEIVERLTCRQFSEDPKEKLLFCLDDTWRAMFADLDPLLKIWNERKKLAKMVTDYIPKLYVDEEQTIPAKIIHPGYAPLKKTGRTSSFASKLYPSRNSQNVDPRIRSCTIPRQGNVLVSTDYSGMELGTLAQRCYSLFGHSVLRDKINDGTDVHAYLGAQIAYTMDPTFKAFIDGNSQAVTGDFIYGVFKQLKGSDAACDSVAFQQTYAALHPEATGAPSWGDFYGHYRKFAKPTDLGYPGGLGARTFIAYAKGTFGIDVTLAEAQSLKEIWANTFPEIPMYLDWVTKNTIDYNYQGETSLDEHGNPKKVRYYTYDTPRGLHRAKCTFCQAANGGALQAPSAEGATDALYQAVKRTWLADDNDILDGVIILDFIHDELLWECPEDDKIGLRAREIEQIMITSMKYITPDVAVSAESAAMRRWDKKAEPLWDGDTLNIWEPKGA